MGLRRKEFDSTHGRRDLSTPPFIEIQKQIGKTLREQYQPQTELPHSLLTLLIQWNDAGRKSADHK